MSTYTPAAGDIGSVLSAKAMYDDDEGDDKAAEQDSAHAAREAPTSNVHSDVPQSRSRWNSEDTAQTREIAENTPAGTNIGAPVAASDTDVLTYSPGRYGRCRQHSTSTGQPVILDHQGRR